MVEKGPQDGPSRQRTVGRLYGSNPRSLRTALYNFQERALLLVAVSHGQDKRLPVDSRSQGPGCPRRACSGPNECNSFPVDGWPKDPSRSRRGVGLTASSHPYSRMCASRLIESKGCRGGAGDKKKNRHGRDGPGAVRVAEVIPDVAGGRFEPTISGDEASGIKPSSLNVAMLSDTVGAAGTRKSSRANPRPNDQRQRKS